MAIFMENLKKITKHNERYKNDEISFKMAINKFGDLTQSEFNSQMKGFNHTRRVKYVAT